MSRNTAAGWRWLAFSRWAFGHDKRKVGENLSNRALFSFDANLARNEPCYVFVRVPMRFSRALRKPCATLEPRAILLKEIFDFESSFRFSNLCSSNATFFRGSVLNNIARNDREDTVNAKIEKLCSLFEYILNVISLFK